MDKQDIRSQTVPAVTVVKKMKDYSKEPFFVKKKEQMIALLKKHGSPDGGRLKIEG